ncbi:MAG TPA: oligosaccharide flippase family protein [Bacteroidia bacterium]|jgi:O-antigen/teichoic acid export membrane protein|nr:oligosaccharide flippase family protein [Bacteroidia bacterium]
MAIIRRQGIKNVIYGYIGILLGVLSTLYIQPFFLTEEQIGITRLVLSVSTILALISNMGTTTTIVKFLPHFYDPEKKHKGFFTMVILFPLIGFSICFSILMLFKKNLLGLYGENAHVLDEFFWPIILITFLNCIVFSFNAYCSAINKTSILTLINDVLNRIGFIACVLLFSYGFFTQDSYIYSLSLIYFVQLVLLFMIIKHFDAPVIRFSFFSNNHLLKEILKYCFYSSFIQVTGICTKFIDVVFIGKYQSMQQVGIYSIAAFIGLILDTPLNAVEKIAGVKVSRLFAANNLPEIEKIYKLSSKYLMMFCGLMGSVLVICIEPMLSLLPGNYSSGTWVTVIICLGAFFNAVTGINYSILTYSNLYRFSALFYFLLLVLIVILNIFFIPLYGITGAAMATMIASVVHNIFRSVLIRIKLNMQPFTIDSFKILLIISVSILSAYWITIENKYLLILLRGTVCTGVFLLLLTVFKVFSIREIKQEISGFKNTFS